MKKILFTISVAAMLGLGMTSCNNQPQKNDTQKEALRRFAETMEEPAPEKEKEKKKGFGKKKKT